MHVQSQIPTDYIATCIYIHKTGLQKKKKTQIDDKLSTIKQDKKQTNQKNTWQSIDSKLTSIAK